MQRKAESVTQTKTILLLHAIVDRTIIDGDTLYNIFKREVMKIVIDMSLARWSI